MTSSNDREWPESPYQLSDEETERFADLLWAQNDPGVAASFPDKIVAVYDRQVRAWGDDTESVLRSAEEKGFPRDKVTLTTIFGPGILFGED